MQLTTSSGPMLVAGHDLAHELLGGGEDGGRFVGVDGRRAAQGEEAHRGAIMPVMRRAAVVLLALPGRLRRGRQARVPSPSAPRQLTITSPDFPANGAIPARFSCDGDKARPALRFAGVPAGAAELALIVVDPDAGGFVHWTVYAPAARHARAGRHRAARRRARGRELDRRDRLDAALPAQRHPPLRVPPVLAEARERPRRRRQARRRHRRRARERGRQRPARRALRAPLRLARAASRRRWTSAAVSRRWRPAVRSPRRNGPKATRRRSTTRWPTASHIRRTWRLRPSWIVSSSSWGRAGARGPARCARRRARRPRAARAARARSGARPRAPGRCAAPRSAGG